VPQLSSRSTSPATLAQATFTWTRPAVVLTTTPIESSALSPGSKVPLKVQVTVWPEGVHVQLSPDDPRKLRPAGRMSVTVIGGDATPAFGSFRTSML
jgi:hypothetical protein